MKTLHVVIATVCLLNLGSAFAGEVRHFRDGQEGLPEAVRVQRGGLAHTRMLLSRDDGTGDFGFPELAERLSKLAASCGAELADVAKLNVYIADPGLVRTVQDGVRQAWPDSAQPAVTIVPTSIFDGESQIALDAVIAVDDPGKDIKRIGNDAAVLPAGRDILYLSGRAASGELAPATAGTMQQLFGVLEHLGSTPSDVVQVKAFIKPMSGWKTVAQEIKQSFGEVKLPPVIYVEWTSPSRATEIELIAAAPDRAETTQTVTYFTPPGDKSSPVFSRVARVHADEVIYISGQTGSDTTSPEQEVRSLFATLERVATHAGSDLRHFAKATYYVSEAEPSAALNQLRPDYYDPERPPAASKIAVPSVGVPGRGLLIDMIAVPTAK